MGDGPRGATLERTQSFESFAPSLKITSPPHVGSLNLEREKKKGETKRVFIPMAGVHTVYFEENFAQKRKSRCCNGAIDWLRNLRIDKDVNFIANHIALVIRISRQEHEKKIEKVPVRREFAV